MSRLVNTREVHMNTKLQYIYVCNAYTTIVLNSVKSNNSEQKKSGVNGCAIDRTDTINKNLTIQ